MLIDQLNPFKQTVLTVLTFAFTKVNEAWVAYIAPRLASSAVPHNIIN